MEFPFGHRHNKHDEEEDDHDRRYQPAGVYPPPGVHHVSHDRGYDPPPPFSGGQVNHFCHESGPAYSPQPPIHWESAPSHQFSGAPFPHATHDAPYGHHSEHVDRVSHESLEWGSMNQQQTARIFTKAEENYSLSIRDGKVVLALKNPSDPHQHWIKDLKYSTKVKDEEGFPAFALVNKATGEAVKHSFGATKPVGLIPYNPNYPDESVLWSESRDLGDGFRCIRMVNNIRLNFDAFNGDEDHGGVHDGTIIVLWEWLKGKNQRWKISPY